MPPDTVLEAHEIAPAANRCSEFCHKACKRKLNDVRRMHTEAGRHLGVRAAWAPKPAFARAGTSAKDKATSLVDEAVSMLAGSLISRGCTITMIDEEAVQMYESAQSGDSGGSALQGSDERESAESCSHSAGLTAVGKRKVGMGSGIGTLKHVNLERLKPPALLQAAKRRAEALSDAVKELNRKTEQYRKWKADAVSQKRLNDLLEGALQEAREMFDDVEAAVNELRERLQLFDEAAAILHAAGQEDVPMLYAANVVRGDIAPTCIFSRFMGDAMHCFEQYVPETRRISPNVKDWLAFAEAQSSPARCMKILCGDLRKRELMGLPIPTARTLRDHARRSVGEGAAVRLGRVNQPNIRAFVAFQRAVRAAAVTAAVEEPSVESRQQQTVMSAAAGVTAARVSSADLSAAIEDTAMEGGRKRRADGDEVSAVSRKPFRVEPLSRCADPSAAIVGSRKRDLADGDEVSPASLKLSKVDPSLDSSVSDQLKMSDGGATPAARGVVTAPTNEGWKLELGGQADLGKTAAALLSGNASGAPATVELNRRRGEVACETLLFHIALGWDETDFDKRLLTSTDGHYTMSGDVDLSAIGKHDPKPLEDKQRRLLQPLDSLIRGEIDRGAMQAALDELCCGVRPLRAAVCIAKRAYESRKTRYDKRNERNRQRTMLGKEPAGAQKKAAKKKAQKKAASPEGRILTISSIADVEDALRDKSLPASDTVDRKHAQRLSGRLVRRTFGDEDDQDEEQAVESEEPVRGVAQLHADDDGDGFWYSIHYPGIKDADVVDLDCLVTGDLESSGGGTLDLVPFAEMTMPQLSEAKDLTKDALYEELAARRELGIYKGKLAKATSKPALAAALFSHLSNLREQLEQLYAIAEGVALGEIDEGIAETAVDQLQQTAGRQAEAPVATEPLIADSPPSQLDGAVFAYNAKQTNEMDQLSEAMERAEYKLARTLSVIATARRAGFRVPPDGDDLLDTDHPETVRDEKQHDADDAEIGDEATSNEPVAGDTAKSDFPRVVLRMQPKHGMERHIDAVCKSVAHTCIESALASYAQDEAARVPPPSPEAQPEGPLQGGDLVRLALQVKTQLLEYFTSCRTAASKVLAFNIADLSHRFSINIARFAVSSTMDSDTLNELVEYVLSEIKRGSDGMLNVLFEKADGALTNLIRELRASVRSSVRPKMIGDQGSLPCSAREVALECNQATRNWQVRREASIMSRLEQSSATTTVSKAAMKQIIFDAWVQIKNPISARHSPNLYGWIHQTMARRQVMGAADGGLERAAPTAMDDEEDLRQMALQQIEQLERERKSWPLEQEWLKAEEEHDQTLSVHPSAGWDQDALMAALMARVTAPANYKRTTLPFLAPLMKDSRCSSPWYMRPVGPFDMHGQQQVLVPEAVEHWEACPDGSFKNVQRDAPERSGALHPVVQRAAAFRQRVDRAAIAGTSGDPQWDAARGATFSARTIRCPAHRRLFQRLRDMRPERHDRPLAKKMKKTDANAPSIDEMLRDSLLQPMPKTPTRLGVEGLASALLSSSIEAAEEDAPPLPDEDAPPPPRPYLGYVSSSVLLEERRMRLAVDAAEVTVKDMLNELRVALMDRMIWELATFHKSASGQPLDLRDQVIIRDGRWFLQCWVHKYKNNVQGIRNMADDDEGSESFSKGRLLRVVKKLIGAASSEKDEKKYRAVLMGLLGKTDMLSQSALTWVMLCPEFLDALDAEPDCWREHTVLTILGLAFLAWDMAHLTDVERSHRIELCEALLIYTLAGEQMYLPFLNESNQGAEPGLVGILASKIGPFTSQNLIAFLQNGAARRQFRQQFPDEYQSLVELSLNNNDLENFFSLIAQQLGYKPMLRDFEARCQQLDFLQRTQLDPFRDFMIWLSKRKKYDLCELLLPQSVLEWNDGIAIDPQHPFWIEYLEEVARRAVAANKGKFEGIHQQHKKAATGAR